MTEFEDEVIRLLKEILKTVNADRIEKPAKYTDAWWKEVAEFNKQLKEQEK
jgi:hypothetical protein